MKTGKIAVFLVALVVFLSLVSPFPSAADAANGGEILSGETKSGEITATGQSDSYAFEAKAGQSIVIEMAADGSSLGPAVSLFSPAGNLETKMVSANGVLRVRLEDYQIKQSGTYSVVASASDDAKATGRYGLSLVLIGGGSSSKQDPDGGAISFGQKLSASINPSGDTDSFTFEGKADQGIVIEMAASGSNLGPAVYLYSPDAALETKLAGGKGATLVSLKDYQLKKSGTYTIVTSASGGADMTGAYSLVLAPSAVAVSPVPTTLEPGTAPQTPPQAVFGNTFSNSVPLPSQVSTDPRVIATNLLFASLMVIIFYVSSTLFNSTFRENYETIGGWAWRIAGWFRLSRPKGAGALQVKRRRPLDVQVILIVLVTAAINSIVDPHFGFGRNGAIVFFAMIVASVASTYGYDGIQALVTMNAFHIPATVKAYPLAILLAITFVIISRVMHFYPGLIFGFVGAYSVISTGAHPDKRQRSVSVISGVLVITVVAVLAFLVRQPLAKGEGFWHSLVDTSLVAVFVICIEGMVFGLLPLTFLDGGTLSSWKKWVWVVVFGLVSFLFFHIIVNKARVLTDAVTDINVVTMLGLAVFYALLSILFWLYFRLRAATIAG